MQRTMSKEDIEDSKLVRMLHTLGKEYYEYTRKFTFGWIYPSAESYIAIHKVISKYMGGLQGMSILDIGCGVGTYLYVLKKLGADVVGIDVDQKAVDIGRQYGIDLRECSVKNVGELFEPETFDAIISRGLFEWPIIEDVDGVLPQLYEITKRLGVGIHEAKTASFLFSERDFERAGFKILPSLDKILGEYVNLIAVGKNN